MEILTAQSVAALLKISKRRAYELASEHTRTGEARTWHLVTVDSGD